VFKKNKVGEAHKFREDMKYEYKMLVGKAQGKRPFRVCRDGSIVTNCTCKKGVVYVWA
jgi:hypothetical protein